MSEPMPSDAVVPATPEPPAESPSPGVRPYSVGDGASRRGRVARSQEAPPRQPRRVATVRRSTADGANRARGRRRTSTTCSPSCPTDRSRARSTIPRWPSACSSPASLRSATRCRRPARPVDDADRATTTDSPARRKRRRGGRGRGSGPGPGAASPSPPTSATPRVELDEETLARQRGRERKGRPIGRYLMCVHVRPGATQIAVLEGRSLIEHYVSKPERRPDADPREHLPGAGAERAARHGGRVRRHRHAEERGALPRRRAVRPGGHRREGRERPHRADPQATPDDRLPGHQEPDRGQGRPAHARGVAARAVRRAHPELEHLRHLEAAERRRAQAAARHPRSGQARRSTA